MKTVVIACSTLRDELDKVMSDLACPYPVVWIESGLHIKPESLRGRLQEELDRLKGYDQALLAFGNCGNALIGLRSPSCRIVFPRVEDCISLFIGSDQRRWAISNQQGTYFLTRGWLDYERNIWADYLATVQRQGREKTDTIYRVMLQHYSRLGIIDTGAYDLGEFRRRTGSIAAALCLREEVIPGTLAYLKKLLTGPWDGDFVVGGAGETVTLHHFYG